MNLQRLGAAAAVLAVLVSACGGEPEPPPEATSTATGTPSTGSPSPEVPADEPSAAPATGRLMKLPGATARAPRGWEVEEQDFVQAWGANDAEGYWSIFLAQNRGNVTSLEHLIDTGVLDDRFKGEPEVSYDVELGGQPAFRASGRDALGFVVTYGAVHDGPTTMDSIGVTLTFGPDESVPARERRRIEEAVVASFEWR